MKNIKSLKNKVIYLLTILLFGTFSCRKTEDAANYDIVFVALTDNNSLMTLNSNNPAAPSKKVDITGLASGEKMLGIDYRPATGQLYGFSNGSKLYILNAEAGAARAVNANAFTPAVDGCCPFSINV